MHTINQRSTLCLRHRRALELDPLRASQCWHQALHDARHQVNNTQWHSVKNRYAQALELAEILLHNDNNPKRCDARLIATAKEFAYLLRVLSISTKGLEQHLRGCLANTDHIHTKPIKQIYDLFEDINGATRCDCAAWLRDIARSHLVFDQQIH